MHWADRRAAVAVPDSLSDARMAGIGASLPLDATATNDEVCPKADLASCMEVGWDTRPSPQRTSPEGPGPGATGLRS
jgi:hypothetical protein